VVLIAFTERQFSPGHLFQIDVLINLIDTIECLVVKFPQVDFVLFLIMVVRRSLELFWRLPICFKWSAAN